MVMPIYDDNPFKLPHRPLVTWGLIIVNVVVFFSEFSGASGAQAVVDSYGLTPAALTGEIKPVGAVSPPTTVFTSMFLHADIMHLLGNMVFLWVFGDNVEEALGRLRFLVFYLLCGVIGALVFVASDAHGRGPLIGASGAISGIIIAYVMLRPCAKVTVLVSVSRSSRCGCPPIGSWARSRSCSSSISNRGLRAMSRIGATSAAWRRVAFSFR
jgi:membrane associated rhomboid family serine protease